MRRAQFTLQTVSCIARGGNAYELHNTVCGLRRRAAALLAESVHADAQYGLTFSCKCVHANAAVNSDSTSDGTRILLGRHDWLTTHCMGPTHGTHLAMHCWLCTLLCIAKMVTVCCPYTIRCLLRKNHMVRSTWS